MENGPVHLGGLRIRVTHSVTRCFKKQVGKKNVLKSPFPGLLVSLTCPADIGLAWCGIQTTSFLALVQMGNRAWKPFFPPRQEKEFLLSSFSDMRSQFRYGAWTNQDWPCLRKWMSHRGMSSGPSGAKRRIFLPSKEIPNPIDHSTHKATKPSRNPYENPDECA